MSRAAFTALICLALCVCARPKIDGRIDHAVDEAVAGPMADRRFAGVVLVARDGRPLFRKAYGMSHTPDTPFMIMSVSKQFTAALVARLAAAGKLRLDDPASKYLAD